MNAPRTGYDEFPYPSAIFPQTHPDRLGTAAALFGLNPPAIESCRVLELGCGDGMNLLSMAVALPGATFIGVDLAGTPIAAGREIASRLALRNIDLRQADLLDLPDDSGPYDYIIAHGLYSWVPGSVREKILRLCKRSLSACGVAYISYNAQPGNHLREIARGAMQYHVRGIASLTEKVAQARAGLAFIAENASAGEAYGPALKQEAKRVARYNDAAVLHDDLSPNNAAFYFHEFAADAARHGLQYLAEADITDMQTDGLPEPAVRMIDGSTTDVIAREQYLDFLRGRAFRQTLLCHAAAPLNRSPAPEAVQRMFIASTARVESGNPDPAVEGALEFRSQNNAVIATRDETAKRALLDLGHSWPRRLPFSEVAAQAGVQSVKKQADLANFFVATHAIGFTDLHLWPGAFTTTISAQPQASRLARLYLDKSEVVPTLRHTTMKIDNEISRRLVRLLDGTRTKQQVVEELVAFAGEQLREPITSGLEHQLGLLARSGLLVA